MSADGRTAVTGCADKEGRLFREGDGGGVGVGVHTQWSQWWCLGSVAMTPNGGVIVSGSNVTGR